MPSRARLSSSSTSSSAWREPKRGMNDPRPRGVSKSRSPLSRSKQTSEISDAHGTERGAHARRRHAHLPGERRPVVAGALAQVDGHEPRLAQGAGRAEHGVDPVGGHVVREDDTTARAGVVDRARGGMRAQVLHRPQQPRPEQERVEGRLERELRRLQVEAVETARVVQQRLVGPTVSGQRETDVRAIRTALEAEAHGPRPRVPAVGLGRNAAAGRGFDRLGARQPARPTGEAGRLPEAPLLEEQARGDERRVPGGAEGRAATREIEQHVEVAEGDRLAQHLAALELDARTDALAALLHDDAHRAVEERDVRAWPEAQELVGVPRAQRRHDEGHLVRIGDSHGLLETSQQLETLRRRQGRHRRSIVVVAALRHDLLCASDDTQGQHEQHDDRQRAAPRPRRLSERGLRPRTSDRRVPRVPRNARGHGQVRHRPRLEHRRQPPGPEAVRYGCADRGDPATRCARPGSARARKGRPLHLATTAGLRGAADAVA